MKSYRCAVMLAVVLSVMSLGVGDAAVPSKMEKVIVKEAVKPYRALSSTTVYSLAGDKDRVPVQFEDVFDSRLKRGDGPKSVKIDGVRYEPVMVLRARSRLLFLVDATQQPLLRQLLGLPARWPLSKEALRRDIIFKEGQKIAIRGTTVGTHDGKRCVLVHALGGETRCGVARGATLLAGPQGTCRAGQDGHAGVCVPLRQGPGGGSRSEHPPDEPR